jgi:hypothetical protein
VSPASYLGSSSLQADLPLYDGHWVGIAADYAWQVYGHHRVMVQDRAGHVIGQKTRSFPDSRLMAIYRANLSARDHT